MNLEKNIEEFYTSLCLRVVDILHKVSLICKFEIIVKEIYICVCVCAYKYNINV